MFSFLQLQLCQVYWVRKKRNSFQKYQILLKVFVFNKAIIIIAAENFPEHREFQRAGHNLEKPKEQIQTSVLL